MKTIDQYYRLPRQLNKSPAFRVLNIHERHALDCIMEEHQSKSGFVNSGLIVTKGDFMNWGIHTRHISASLKVLTTLGIIERTRGMGGSAIGRTPNTYRPTFLPTTPTANDATHDYLEIETMEEAKRRAEIHRSHEKRKGRMPSKKLRVISAPIDSQNRGNMRS